MGRAQVPPTPPPAAPSPDLPQERWDNKDITMLDGCWHKYTNLVTTDLHTGRDDAVHEWKLCFGGTGHGHQTIIWNDGRRCEGDLRAKFATDGALDLRDVSHCHGSRNMLPEESTCRRLDDHEAECDMRDLEGPHAGMHEAVPSRFRR